jgi:DNA repair exonuclease SbcCD ATPase subunit
MHGLCMLLAHRAVDNSGILDRLRQLEERTACGEQAQSRTATELGEQQRLLLAVSAAIQKTAAAAASRPSTPSKSVVAAAAINPPAWEGAVSRLDARVCGVEIRLAALNTTLIASREAQVAASVAGLSEAQDTGSTCAPQTEEGSAVESQAAGLLSERLGAVEARLEQLVSQVSVAKQDHVSEKAAIVQQASQQQQQQQQLEALSASMDARASAHFKLSDRLEVLEKRVHDLSAEHAATSSQLQSAGTLHDEQATQLASVRRDVFALASQLEEQSSQQTQQMAELELDVRNVGQQLEGLRQAVSDSASGHISSEPAKSRSVGVTIDHQDQV